MPTWGDVRGDSRRSNKTPHRARRGRGEVVGGHTTASKIRNDPLSVPFQGQVEEDRSGRKYFLRDSRAWWRMIFSGELEYQFHRYSRRENRCRHGIGPMRPPMTREGGAPQSGKVGYKKKNRDKVPVESGGAAGSGCLSRSWKPVENLGSITL